MIKIIRQPNDPKADAIESRFKELILSYKTEYSEGDNLPKVKDGETTVSGDDDIEIWLRELEDELTWQRSLSGDCCYINPKSGKVC